MTLWWPWFSNGACSSIERKGVTEIEVPSSELLPPDSEDVLKILNVIKDDPALSQRELSSRLGISLGKVNYLIKSLIEKGLVKVDSFRNATNKISYLYKLTPSGIEEKARTTYYFLRRKMEEYERLEREIRDLQREISVLEVQREGQTGNDIRQ